MIQLITSFTKKEKTKRKIIMKFPPGFQKLRDQGLYSPIGSSNYCMHR